MNGRIKIGVPISTDNIPAAFFKWFNEIKETYPYRTMEVRGGEIQVVRVRIPIDGIETVKQLVYGKISSDSSGEFLEKTFIPRYSKERDEIILEQ
jgi:DNA gyrase inhibitor GyrI